MNSDFPSRRADGSDWRDYLCVEMYEALPNDPQALEALVLLLHDPDRYAEAAAALTEALHFDLVPGEVQDRLWIALKRIPEGAIGTPEVAVMVKEMHKAFRREESE